MNYQESIAYLKSLSPTLEKPGLARMKAFLELNFDLAGLFPVLHVAGTNGKGSVTTILQSLLSGLNLRAAKFTGPHLLTFNERFVVGKEAITDEELARLISKVAELSQEFGEREAGLGSLTWFEVLTACAAFYFQEQKIDCAVLEVGLGGRFDATNAFQNIVCSVITNVDLDHCHILGQTKEAIAWEKAGILRVGRPVITACVDETDDRAFPVILSRAAELSCPVVHLLGEEHMAGRSSGLELACYGFDEVELAGLNSYIDFLEEWVLADWSRDEGVGLAGAYQSTNVALALVALYFSEFLPWPCDEAQLAGKLLNSLRNISWPGRFQRLTLNMGEKGTLALILDGAHNCHGVRALRRSLPVCGRQIFIFACYANKEPAKMLEALLRDGDILLTCPLEGERQACEPATIVALAKGRGVEARSFESLEKAMEEACRLLAVTAANNEYRPEVVVCGSFALVRQVLHLKM